MPWPVRRNLCGLGPGWIGPETQRPWRGNRTPGTMNQITGPVCLSALAFDKSVCANGSIYLVRGVAISEDGLESLPRAVEGFPASQSRSWPVKANQGSSLQQHVAKSLSRLALRAEQHGAACLTGTTMGWWRRAFTFDRTAQPGLRPGWAYQPRHHHADCQDGRGSRLAI